MKILLTLTLIFTFSVNNLQSQKPVKSRCHTLAIAAVDLVNQYSPCEISIFDEAVIYWTALNDCIDSGGEGV